MKKTNLFRLFLILVLSIFFGITFISQKNNVNAGVSLYEYDSINYDQELNSQFTGGELSPGNYCLTGDVTLSSSITCNGNLNIFLNDHLLNITSTSTTVQISVTGDFGLYEDPIHTTVRYFTGSFGSGFHTIADNTFNPEEKTEGTDYVKTTGGVVFAAATGGNNYGLIEASGKTTIKNVNFAGAKINATEKNGISVVKVNGENSELKVDGCKFYGSLFVIPNGGFFDIRDAKNVTFNNITVKYTYSPSNNLNNFVVVKDTATHLVKFEVKNSLFEKNIGLALFNLLGADTDYQFDSCTFKNGTQYFNHSCGGAINLKCNSFTIKDSSFTNNNGDTSYGVIYGSCKTVLIENTLFDTNGAYHHAASLYLFADNNTTGNSVTIKGNKTDNQSKFNKNITYGISSDVTTYGGAIYLKNIETVNILDTEFTYNSCKCSNNGTRCGGAIYFENCKTINITDSLFDHNESDSYGGALLINNSTTVNIESTTFTNNFAMQSGGAIYANKGAFTLDSVTATSNKASSNYGGFLYLVGTEANKDSNSVIIKGTEENNKSIYTSNESREIGGVFYLGRVKTVDVSYTAFTSNKSTYSKGGAIAYDDGDSLDIKNSTFTSNASSYNGGAVYANKIAEIEVSDSTFTSNLSTGSGGGAIYSSEGTTITLTDSIFNKNSASGNSGDGGAIFVNKGKVVINGVSASENTSNGNGGFLALVCSTKLETNSLEITGTLENNKAIYSNNKSSGGAGGAIYTCGADKVTISYAEFEENISLKQGGAIYTYNTTNFIIKDCSFNENEAKASTSNLYDHGGAIYLSTITKVTINDSIFSKNKSAYRKGGALYFEYVTETEIKNTELKENHSKEEGGAIYLKESPKVTLIDVTAKSNEALAQGGFMFYDGIYGNDTYNVVIKGTPGDNNKSIFESNVGYKGGAISFNNGYSLTINDTKFESNKTNDQANLSSAYGSAVHVYRANSVTIEDSAFNSNVNYKNNDNNYRFSTVFFDTVTTANVTDSTFKNNKNGYYGVLYSTYTSLTVTGSTFESNTAAHGGAIYVTNSSLTVDNSMFKKNNSTFCGGAIYAGNCSNKNIVIKTTDDENRTTFIENSARQNSGALYVGIAASLTIDDVLFTKNYIDQNYLSESKNSVMYVDQISDVTINDTDITYNVNKYDDNSNNYRCGSVYIKNSGLTISNTKIENNTAGRAGILTLDTLTSFNTSGTVSIKNNETAFTDGILLFLGTNAITFDNENLTITENKTKGYIIYNKQNDLYLKKCSITKNDSGSKALIFVGNTTLYLSGSTILSENTSGTGTDKKQFDFFLDSNAKIAFDSVDELKTNSKYYIYVGNTYNAFATVNVKERYANNFIISNEGSYLAIYKDESLKVHEHSWTFTQEFNKLNFVCSNNQNEKYSLELNYKTHYLYNNGESCVETSVSVTNPDNITIPEYKILYKGRGNTAYTRNTTAPTAVGHYIAILQYNTSSIDNSTYYSFDIVEKAIYVNGVDMTNGGYLANGEDSLSNEVPLEGGYAYFDKNTNTLTLNNAVINKGKVVETSEYTSKFYIVEAGIYANFDLNISLVGENNILPTNFTYSKQQYSSARYLYGSGITVLGGNLTIDSSSNGTLNFKNDENKEFHYGIDILTGNLIINGGNINFYKMSTAISNRTYYEYEIDSSGHAYSTQNIANANILPYASPKTAGLIKILGGSIKSHYSDYDSFFFMSSDLIIGENGNSQGPNIDLFVACLESSRNITKSYNNILYTQKVIIPNGHSFNYSDDYPIIQDVFFESESVKLTEYNKNYLSYYGDFEVTNGIITKASIPVNVAVVNGNSVISYKLIEFNTQFDLSESFAELFKSGLKANQCRISNQVVELNNNCVLIDKTRLSSLTIGNKNVYIQVETKPYVEEVASNKNDYEFTVNPYDYGTSPKSIEYKWYYSKTEFKKVKETDIYLSHPVVPITLGSMDEGGYITSKYNVADGLTYNFYFATSESLIGEFLFKSTIANAELNGKFYVFVDGEVEEVPYDSETDSYKAVLSSGDLLCFGTSAQDAIIPQIYDVRTETLVKGEEIDGQTTNKYTGDAFEIGTIFYADVILKNGENIDLTLTYKLKYTLPHKHGETMFAEELTSTNYKELFEFSDYYYAYLFESGSYYLTGDLELDDYLMVPEGADVSICLNGYSLNVAKRYIYVYGKLSIYDCSEEKTGKIIDDSSQGYYMFYMYNNSTFNLYSGSIVTNNYADEAIYVTGTGVEINVYSGTVDLSGNNSSYFIYDDYGCTLNIYGGIFSGSKDETSTYGTLMYAYIYNNKNTVINIYDGNFNELYSLLYACSYNGSNVTVNLYDGTITDVVNPFYVCLYGESSNFTLNMFDGEITGSEYGFYNSPDSYSYNSNFYLNLYGGSITNSKFSSLYAYAYENSGVYYNLGGSFVTDCLSFFDGKYTYIDFATGEYAPTTLDVTIDAYNYNYYKLPTLTFMSKSSKEFKKYFKAKGYYTNPDDPNSFVKEYIKLEYDNVNKEYKYVVSNSNDLGVSETVQSYAYDGNAKAFEIISEFEGFTVKYYQGATEVASPVEIGVYDVKVTRAQDDTFDAYEKTIIGGLVIKQLNTISNFTVSDTTCNMLLDIHAESVSDPIGITITFLYSNKENGIYTNTMPTKAGTYYVKAISESNEEYESDRAVKTFTINHNTIFNRFVWAEDYSAQAEFICIGCSKVLLYDATVTSEVTLEPTVQEPGIKKYTAKYGEYTDYNQELLPPHSHNHEYKEFVWTNFTAKAVYECSCGDQLCYDATVTSAVTKDATCTAKGVRTYTATYDGHTDTKTEDIAMIEHNHQYKEFTWTNFTAKAVYECSCGDQLSYDATVTSAVTKDATCTAKGVRTYTATYDSHTDTKTEDIATIEHNHQYKEFTWTNFTAKAVYECSCGDKLEYTAVITNDITTAPTCTTKGIKTYTATYDGHTDTKTEDVAMIEHDYQLYIGFVWTEFTAQAKYSCSCGAFDLKTATITSSVTTAPTCEAKGLKTYTATYGSHTDTKTEDINATGHAYTIVYEWTANYKCTQVKTCTNNSSHIVRTECKVKVKVENGAKSYIPYVDGNPILTEAKVVSENDQELVKDETKSNSTTVDIIDLIRGTLETTVKVVVNDKEKEVAEAVKESIKEKASKKHEVVAKFDIHLEDQNGNIVPNQEGNAYIVTLNIPTGFKSLKDVKVICINDDDTVEVYEVQANEDGSISFETTHFSSWAIIANTSLFPWWAIVLIVLGSLIVIFVGLFFIWKAEYDKAINNNEEDERKLMFLDVVYRPINDLLFNKKQTE